MVGRIFQPVFDLKGLLFHFYKLQSLRINNQLLRGLPGLSLGIICPLLDKGNSAERNTNAGRKRVELSISF